MASTNEDIVGNEASLTYTREEETRDAERHVAFNFQKKDNMRYPPEQNDTPSVFTLRKTIYYTDFFQCSQDKTDYGYGSDSAEEESSPYSSTNNLKYEEMAPSGKTNTNSSRQQRLLMSSCQMDEQLVEQSALFFEKVSVVQHMTGPNVQEDNTTACGTLALSGKRYNSILLPRLEVLSVKNVVMPENYHMRLATFRENKVGWPHDNPSAEDMAIAGFIFRGVFTENGSTFCDMVECDKCGGTLYGFEKGDDPIAEHERLYPQCK